MAPSIVPAVESDLDAIQRIYAHEVEHGTATYEVEPPDRLEMANRWRAIVEGAYPYLVARFDGEVAGYAYGSAYRSREGYRWTVEDSVYVDARFRGRGVGDVLLGAVVDACTRGGWRQMIAVVGDGANAASIRLHERHGFRVAARFPGLGRKHGRWLENVQMLRALGDGDSTAPVDRPLFRTY
ncbi:N-acetyltransferase family protein [Lysobacter xanthus]